MVLNWSESKEVFTRKGADTVDMLRGCWLDAEAEAGPVDCDCTPVSIVSMDASVVWVDVLPTPTIGCSQTSHVTRVCF